MSASYNYPPTATSLVWPSGHPLNPANYTGNGLKMMQMASDESEYEFTIPFPDASLFSASDDQKKLVYDHATTSFKLEMLPMWTPNNSASARWWHTPYNADNYTTTGVNNYLTGSTNKIDLFSGSYNISSVDADGVTKSTGVGSLVGWKFTKSLAGYAILTNGIWVTDPSSYTFGCVFSIDSGQVGVTTWWGGIYSVANAYGEDIKLWFVYDGGLGRNVLMFKHNGTTVSSSQIFTVNTVYIVCCSYNGTQTTIYVNGTVDTSATASVTGVGASDLILGAMDTAGGWGGDYNLAGWIYDVCVLTTHDATERKKLEGYFAHQHGLTDKLPGSHTYKYSYPTV
jgi:hypothetical protein